jgi:hypothetical protein
MSKQTAAYNYTSIPVSSYRTQGVIPVYPKEETREEKEKRMSRAKKARSIIGVLVLVIFSSMSLLTLGFEWNAMSTALATTALFATLIFIAGVMTITGIILDW